MSFIESHTVHYRPRESEARRKLISLCLIPIIALGAFMLLIRAILLISLADLLTEATDLQFMFHEYVTKVGTSFVVLIDLYEGFFIWDEISILVCIAIILSMLLTFLYVRSDLRRVTHSFERRKRSAGFSFDSVSNVSDPAKGVFAGQFGKRDFYVKFEDRGLVVGPPRTGKSTFLLNQVLRLTQNNTSFVAVDIKPELSLILREDLEAHGYDIIILDVISAKGSSYNLLDDIHSEQSINELVLSLIPTPPKDPIWVEAQQRYFKLALLHLFHSKKKHCSLPAAYQLIGHFSKAEDFLNYTAQSTNEKTKRMAKKLLGQLEHSQPVQAGFSSVYDKLDWLDYVEVQAALGDSEFSLKQLGQSNKPVALFLQFDESYLETMGALLSTLYGHILKYLIANHKERDPVALFLDEIGNIPPVNGLLQKLNTIASRNIPLWMYWQSTAQMTMYGDDAREVFFGCADAQLFFRSNDLNTQQTVALLSGTVFRPKMSQTEGMSDSTNVSAEKDTRVQAGDVGELELGEVIGFYRGKKLRGRATPHYETFPKYRKSP